jgi:monofunctional glycosyltransferase
LNTAFDKTLRVDPLRRPADATQPPPSALQQPAKIGETGAAKAFVLKALRVAAYAFAGYMALVLALIVVYRFVNPPMSSLMLQQRLAGQEILQEWVSLDAISPQIVRAVLVSEDGRFCQHHGIDLLAMQAAIERASDGVPRGASTISMQVTKNLFLWPSKSYIRKAIEVPLTLAIELLWPKWRIMEVYLNIAEWGPGVFGVESASRFHFDKAAKRLNEREAAQLAVALPNPISRDPGEPGPGTRRLAGTVQGRMRGTSPSQTACVLSSRRGG